MAAAWIPGTKPKKDPSTANFDPIYAALARWQRRFVGGRVVLAHDTDPTVLNYPGATTAPPAPTYTSSAPIPQPKPLIWSNKYGYEGAPSWWQGMVANKNNPYTQYFMTANAMLPFLSPEDQRAFANNLGLQYKGQGTKFGNPMDFTFGTTMGVSPELRAQYQSSQRAQMALNLLDRMRMAAGIKDENKMGKGYQFLRQMIDALRDFGASGRAMSRADYMGFISAIDPLINSQDKTLAAYGALGKSFLQPFFTGGELVGSRKVGNSTYFGVPNPVLYG